MFEEFSSFIQNNPTPYHYTANARAELTALGFKEMNESEEWTDIPKKGFFIRDDRALVAWNDNGHEYALIGASHVDSPCFVLKPNFDEVIGGYRRARCLNYGGGLYYSWFDRDLRLAGRIQVKCKEEENVKKLKYLLYDSKVGIATIPACAPHLDITFSTAPLNLDLEKHFIPIYGRESDPPLKNFIASQLNVDPEDIVAMSLRFIDAQPPNVIHSDLLLSQRLDDMQNTFTTYKAFKESQIPQKGVLNLLVSFDNEEISSMTRCGAMSSIITDTISRICAKDHINNSNNIDENDKKNTQNGGIPKGNMFVMSFDSTHASHPNFMSCQELNHFADIGSGLVIDRSPDSDSSSGVINEYPIRSAAKAIGQKLQTITEPNNEGSGSTIGPMTETVTGISTCDIGAAVWSMHSIRETGSVKDLDYGVKLQLELYNNFLNHRFPL